MTENTRCLIGCITSDDEGRGYYCEECPELRNTDHSVADQCEHGVDYDAECTTCEAEIAEAKTAGAMTPHEIGLYWKGAEAASAQVAAKALSHAQEVEQKLGLVRGLLAAYGDAEGTPVDYEFLVSQIGMAIDG